MAESLAKNLSIYQICHLFREAGWAGTLSYTSWWNISHNDKSSTALLDSKTTQPCEKGPKELLGMQKQPGQTISSSSTWPSIPTRRTTGDTSYSVIGVDFTGPICYRLSKKLEGNAYLALYACSLTTSSFTPPCAPKKYNGDLISRKYSGGAGQLERLIGIFKFCFRKAVGGGFLTFSEWMKLFLTWKLAWTTDLWRIWKMILNFPSWRQSLSCINAIRCYQSYNLNRWKSTLYENDSGFIEQRKMPSGYVGRVSIWPDYEKDIKQAEGPSRRTQQKVIQKVIRKS